VTLVDDRPAHYPPGQVRYTEGANRPSGGERTSRPGTAGAGPARRDGSVRRRIQVIGLVLLVAAAARASRPLLPPGPGSSPAAPTRVSVDVVGDSLISQSGVELADRLAAAGYTSTIAHRPAQDLGSPFIQGQLAAVRDRGRADVLVLATAANDVLRDDDRTAASGPDAAARAFTELFDRALAPFADRCVVVVNAREDTAALYHPEHAKVLNALLARAAERHPGVVVVDWASISHPLPGSWFAPDQLHFGPDPGAPALGSGSARAYATAILDGIRRCPHTPS
jgi:hypothetical protein